MKKLAFLITLLILILAACSAQKSFLCNKPYMQIGSECCLDANDNKICDKDETLVKQAPENTSAPAANNEPKQVFSVGAYYGDANGSKISGVDTYEDWAQYYLWVVNLGNVPVECNILREKIGIIFNDNKFNLYAGKNYSKLLSFMYEGPINGMVKVNNTNIKCNIKDNTSVSKEYTPEISIYHWGINYEEPTNTTFFDVERNDTEKLIIDGVRYNVTVTDIKQFYCDFSVNNDVKFTLHNRETKVVYNKLRISLDYVSYNHCTYIINT